MLAFPDLTGLRVHGQSLRVPVAVSEQGGQGICPACKRIVLRYGAVLPLVIMLPLNVALLGAGAMYKGILILQLAFYLCAAAGASAVSRSRIFAWPWYFVLVNLASGAAFVRFFRGEKQVLWVPREGT